MRYCALYRALSLVPTESASIFKKFPFIQLSVLTSSGFYTLLSSTSTCCPSLLGLRHVVHVLPASYTVTTRPLLLAWWSGKKSGNQKGWRKEKERGFIFYQNIVIQGAMINFSRKDQNPSGTQRKSSTHDFQVFQHNSYDPLHIGKASLSFTGSSNTTWASVGYCLKKHICSQMHQHRWGAPSIRTSCFPS